MKSDFLSLSHENSQALKHSGDHAKQDSWLILALKPSVYNPWHLSVPYITLNNVAMKALQDTWKGGSMFKTRTVESREVGSNPDSMTY